jgi:phytoene desaturase
MAKVAEKNGATMFTETPIKKIITHDGVAKGILLEDNTQKDYDAVIINSDFGTAMTQLFEPSEVPKYTSQKLDKKGFSCSTFMAYIALDTVYDLPFHTIYFANNYRDNLQRIHKHQSIDENDFSFYVRNASILDTTLAPKGHS